MCDTRQAEQTELTLEQATAHLLEESRMVLPGMQALFGFQLIAVFNSAFSDRLDILHQRLHLASIALVVVAIALIMTPAAYHRQTAPRGVSAEFVAISSRLILASMVPLAAAICLDFYVVAWLIVDRDLAAWGAAILLMLFIALWFVFPRFFAAARSRHGHSPAHAGADDADRNVDPQARR
jgi:hypothetical protein